MKSFLAHVDRFLKSEDGPTAVEYAVMVALIIIVCITAIRGLSTSIQTTFNTAASTMSGVTGGS